MRKEVISTNNVCPVCGEAAVTLEVWSIRFAAGLVGECSSCLAVARYVTPCGPRDKYLSLLKEWITGEKRVAQKLAGGVLP